MRAGILPAVGAVAVLWAAGAAAQETVFQVKVRLVRLLATVKDAAGGPVAGLDREDFSVFDNGVPQQIAVFERHSERPLSVALLVDSSGSTAIRLEEETGAVLRFLGSLFAGGNPEDAVALYSFNHDVTLESSFTRRVKRIEKELRTIKPEAGTSLYDAIHFAARALETRDGRRVLIVVTDGADTTSVKRFEDALVSVHGADAALYGVMIVPVANDPGRHVAGENALAALAAGTGGRVFPASLDGALDEAFAGILRELRTQYLIGYYPKDIPWTKERFHRVEVRTGRPGLRVVTRSGYYGEYGEPAPQGSLPKGPSLEP